MDPTQPAPDPQALQMLMALMGGGNGNAVPAGSPLVGGAAQQQQLMNMPQAPLMNGQNASLGATTGASLATPQDMMMNSMMQPVPQQ